jgi:DNA-directed RNA polymerase specialized sigma24 family protein
MTSISDLKSSDLVKQTAGFASLKADVYPICFRRLEKSFPQETDDVVMEVMQEIFEQVDKWKSDEELAKATSRIAMFRAINRWKELTTKKRGQGKILSLDELRDRPGQANQGDFPEQMLGQRINNKPLVSSDAFTLQLSELDTQDIVKILETLQKELKPMHRLVIKDVLAGMEYAQISLLRGLPLGTVCGYAKRGIATMRKLRLKYPQLTKEALQYIVKMFL